MEDKKFVRVKGKSIGHDGSVCEAEAVVPFKKGGHVSLPDVPPFNTNVWLDGDTGYNMTSLGFTNEGEVEYFYSHYYEFIDGKVHAEMMIGSDLMIFDFELTDGE